MTTPVFVLSLPRSGSTLLQRLLGAHPDVATTPEAWVMLPPLAVLQRQGGYTAYSHRTAWDGIQDLCDHLPEGRLDYLRAVGDFGRSVYDRAARGERYFVDKTPRYHFVVDDLLAAFPQAPVVFLWRNPLAVAASMIQTWGSGRWNLYRFKRDLYGGFDRLVDAYATCTATGRDVLAVRYEDLVADPATELGRLETYLDLPAGSLTTAGAGTPLAGRTGDPTGQFRYDRVRAPEGDAWADVLAVPLRRAWARRYLARSAERLTAIGYDPAALAGVLQQAPTRWSGVWADVPARALGLGWVLGEPHLVRDKLTRLRPWHDVYSHD